MLEIAASLKDVLVGLLIVLSLSLTVIGALSWYKTSSPRIAMVTGAFALFLLKGVGLAVGLYMFDLVDVPTEFAGAFDSMLALDVIILLVLYLALFRKKRER